jgi:L-fuconolactonase
MTPGISRAIPIRADWLARHDEPALDPAQPIIDAHHHLWRRRDERYLADEFLRDIASGHDVRATVHVQARSMYRTEGFEALRPVGETEFASEVARSVPPPGPRLCAGIVAFADLCLGEDVQPLLDAHRAAGGDAVCGVRHIVAWDGDPDMMQSGNPAPPGLMADGAFRCGFARLEPMGLAFDAWLYHPQLDELAALADAFPGVAIVCDHAGGPIGIGGYAGRRDEVFRDWAAAMRRLSRRSNVTVKLGGLGMAVNGFGFHHQTEPPTSKCLAAALKPYFDVCLDAFGPQRCMFESNFPVDKGSYSYGVFWNACKHLASGLSADERGAVFHATASRIYKLPILTPRQRA